MKSFILRLSGIHGVFMLFIVGSFLQQPVVTCENRVSIDNNEATSIRRTKRIRSRRNNRVNDKKEILKMEDLSSTIKRHFAEADHIQKWEGETLNESISKILAEQDASEYYAIAGSSINHTIYDDDSYKSLTYSGKGKGKRSSKGKGLINKSKGKSKCNRYPEKEYPKTRYSSAPRSGKGKGNSLSPSPSTGNVANNVRRSMRSKGKGKGKKYSDCESEAPSIAPSTYFDITDCDSYSNKW